MNEFTIVSHLTKNDLRRFYQQAWFAFKPFYKGLHFWLSCAALMACSFYLFLRYHDGTLSIFDPILLLLTVFLIILIASYFKTISNAEKMYATNIKLQHEISYTFSEREISSSGYNFQSRYLWNEIYKLVISKSFVLVYVSAGNVIIMPARLFTPAQNLCIQQWAGKK